MRRVVWRPGHPVTADLVHRLDPCGVLLDRWRRTLSSTLLFEASLGGDRVFRRGEDDRVDLLGVAEVVRQAVLATSHLEAGLPLDSALAMQHLEVELLRPDVLGPEDRLDIAARVSEVATDPAGQPTDLTVHLRLRTRGAEAARATVRLSVPQSREFSTRRAQRATAWRSDLPRLDPRLTGNEHADDVLLSAGPTSSTWRLAVDTTRVRYFDHAVNHVPGLVLLAACRQAWAATGGPEPTRLRASFLSYVQLDQPAWVTRVDDGTAAGADEPSLVVTQGHDVAAVVGLFAPERSTASLRGPVGRLLALSRPGRSGPRA